MTALVYPVGRGRADELRYALRSVHAHYGPHLDIWVIGHVPPWVDATAATVVPMRQRHRHAHRAVWDAITAATTHLDQFVLMNTDFFALQPGRLNALHHRGTVADYITAYTAEPDRAVWARRMRRTAAVLAHAGHHGLYAWETHTPLPVTAAAAVRAAAAAAAAGVDMGQLAHRTMIATCADYTGTRLTDPKLHGPDEPLPARTPWVSTSRHAWDGMTGDLIRERYATPSPWERTGDRAPATR